MPATHGADRDAATPEVEFAAALRKLRDDAGRPTYRVMRERSEVSVGALNQAARGEVFPSLRVTRGFVQACGGDLEEWERRWHRAKAALYGQPRADHPDQPSPYPGLARFEPANADVYFGRERLVDRLADLTARFSVAAVLGPSGSGKSSLLRAGLIPRLSRPDGPAPRPGRIRILTPGASPLAAHAERLVPQRTGGDTVVLVDQFEELFTLCQDPAERAAFLDLLLTAREEGSRLRVVIAVRADFLGQCARHAGLTEVLQEATLVVGPMDRDELQQAVVRPATTRGLQVQRSLTSRVVREVEGEPGALPLMSHAMLETWRHRRGPMLTEAAYDAAGGLHGAIAKTAEKVYGGFSPEEAEHARRVLLRLVNPGDGSPDTRRRTDRAELGAELDEAGCRETATVVDRLVAARLLTLDDGAVELAHEALIAAWPRLRSWIDAERDRLRVHRRLTGAAHDWRTLGGDPGALYRGSRLVAAEEAFPPETRERELTPSEQEFLAASGRQRRRGLRARRAMTTALVALSLLATTAAVVAFEQRGTARAERNTAVFHQITTQADGVRDSRRSLAARLDVVARGLDRTPGVESRLLSDAGAALSTPLTGHEGVVSDTAFTPDGATLATAGHDGTVRLWDTADPLGAAGLGTPLEGLPERAEGVDFGAGGTLLAVALNDGSLALWDTADPVSPRPLGEPVPAHPEAVAAVRIAPDGTVLATAGDDGTVRLWDLADRERPALLGAPLDAHEGGVRAVDFAPDGATLVTGGMDESLRLWDIEDPARPLQHGDGVLGHEAPVWSVAVSPDGATVASGGFDETVRLWDVTDPGEPRERAVRTEPEAPVWSVAFGPDGETLAAAGEDNTVRLWNVLNPDYPQPLGEPLAGHSSGVWSVAFRPGDPHTLASAGYNGDLLLWHRPPGVLTDFTNPVTALAYSPDGAFLAAASTDDALVRIWDVRDPRRPERVGSLTGHEGPVTSVAFAPDGETLATAGEDDTVRLWDVADPGRGSQLGAALGGVEEGVRAVAFSPDGRSLVGGGRDGGVLWWTVRDPERPAEAGRGRAPDDGHVNAVAFAPDGRTLATAHQQSTVRLWDLPDTGGPRPTGSLVGHQEAVLALDFSPDGTRLVSGGEDRTLRLWDVADPDRAEPLGPALTGHDRQVNAVAFGPGDGGRVASAGEDAAIRLWDVEGSGAAEEWGQPLTGHTGSVTTVAFSPDGSRLASAGHDLTARLWSLSADEAEEQVCARSRGVLTAAAWERHLPHLPYDPPCEDAERPAVRP